MDVNITKMSSKGQIVIPAEMRDDIKEGEKLLVIKKDGKLVIRKASTLDKELLSDLEFAERTEKAWKDGKFSSMDFDEAIEEMERW